MLARIAEAAALSPSSFHKRYRSTYETPSPSSSPTLPIRMRYRGISELVEDNEDESLDSDTEGEDSKDKVPGLDGEEEPAPKGQQQAVLVVDTNTDEPLGLGYRELRRHESMPEEQKVEETPAPRPPVHATWVDHVNGTIYTDISIYVPPVRVLAQTSPSPKWSSSSLLVSPSSPIVSALVASPATTPAATIAIDKNEFLEVGAQLELYRSILHDHTQHLDALPPALFEGYDRNFRELYTRSRAIRDEIFSPCYRLRSLE
ncbi:hypothetical protein Tco_0417538 [Tanacetum coccineum]